MSWTGRLPLLACALLVSLQGAKAFYYPGAAPAKFPKEAPLRVKVNKLTSTKTQLPYEYYSVPGFCKPEQVYSVPENLGEVLRGDHIESSLYEFKMMVFEPCKVVCKKDALTKVEVEEFIEKIEEDYRVHMILDNLPVAMVKIRPRNEEVFKAYERGYPVGFQAQVEEGGDAKYFLHNHLRFNVLYHEVDETQLARIVGFEVEPFSVRHQADTPGDETKPQLLQSCNHSLCLSTCNPAAMAFVNHGLAPQIVEEGVEVIFTYDVYFRSSPIRWASRWDTYLLLMDDVIHWFSIVNSVIVILFLSSMAAMIMPSFHHDISKYNQLETQDEAQEETGWKLLRGDAFRPPPHYDWLCVLVGTGVQLFGTSLVTMVFAALGFLSPANRGGLMTAMLLLWVFMGLFAGYSSSRLYKAFGGTDWKLNTIKMAVFFPASILVIFVILNCLLWGEKSSGSVPLGTMFALFFLWFGISVPLMFVGSYFGSKKEAPEDPVPTNKIPRQIPQQAWYRQPAFSILGGGILPFGAIFIELYFIFTSIWFHQFYYIFGILLIVFIILMVSCAEVTIVLCNFQLRSEDYRWWWRAYLTSGSSALYVFLYGTFYFFTKLEITKFVSGLLYFGYILIISYSFFLLTGTIGFYACYWFVRTIYGSSYENLRVKTVFETLQTLPTLNEEDVCHLN